MSKHSRVRVFEATDIARNIAETFKDRPIESEEEFGFGWPDLMQQVGDSVGVAYGSDKWKSKNKRGKREVEIYKHIAESRNRIFSVPGVIRSEDDIGRKLRTIGPVVSFRRSTSRAKLLMPESFAILGIFKEANVILHVGGTDEEPEFGEEPDDGVVTLSVKHGMLGASKMKVNGALRPFLFVYTPDDGVYFVIIGDELAIEKDGIVG